MAAVQSLQSWQSAVLRTELFAENAGQSGTKPLEKALCFPSQSCRQTGFQNRRLHVCAAKGRVASERKPTTKVVPEKIEPPVVRADDPMAEREYRTPMPGDQPDLFTGPQWDIFGYFLEYLWAIGIVVALVASVYAVRTYNTGAVDFKDTELYKSAQDAAQTIAPDGLDNSLLDDAPPL